MRLLILSDVHANIKALNAVYNDAGHVDAILCAGDLVDYGTDPHEVIEWMQEHEVLCVSGNHDRLLLHVFLEGEANSVRGTNRYKWVHDNCDRITGADVLFLQKLPIHLTFEADGIEYMMQHQMREGDLAYSLPESVWQFDELWRTRTESKSARKKRIIFGHTHRRAVHILDNDRLWLNPGSVSYRRPDDKDKRAHYMIIENGKILFRAVRYDRTHSLMRTMEYVKNGTMLQTDLQDAMFFFGNATTTRDPLPVVLKGEVKK